MSDGQKIVDFEWCMECKHYEKPEAEDPCHMCLNIKINTNSHKPVYFEEADK